MKLDVIVPVLNQFEIANQCIKFLSQLPYRPYELIVVDNGSSEEFKTDLPDVTVVKYDEPLGTYPVFREMLAMTDADIFAVFHSDFFVYDEDWHTKVLAEFEKDEKLGMIGFVGSNEIDSSGGRGLGTASNFQGRETIYLEEFSLMKDGSFEPGVIKWCGSLAEAHGKRFTGFMKAAVVDGCSMILRRTALESIEYKEDFPPHHFYDRLISTQLLEKGWRIGVLGIACDHISGQTVSQEDAYIELAKKWCTAHHLVPSSLGINWDNEIYKEAERQWLSEYRYNKHFIPLKV